MPSNITLSTGLTQYASTGGGGSSAWADLTGVPVPVSTLAALTASTGIVRILSGTVSASALVNADLPTSGVVAGSYTAANITVNAQGVVTAASNSAGGSSTIAQDSSLPWTTEWNVPARFTDLQSAVATVTKTFTSTYAEYVMPASTLLVGPSLSISRTFANRTFVVEGSCTAGAVSNTAMFWGIGGQSYGTLDAPNAVILYWRQNGALIIANGSGTTVTTWVKSPAENLTQTAWTGGDTLTMVWKFGTDPTTATLKLFKNGIPTTQTFTVTGIQPGCIWAGWRGLSAQTVRLTRLEAYQNDYNPQVYVDQAYVGTSTGSQNQPFNSLEKATGFMEATGFVQADYFLKGGDYRLTATNVQTGLFVKSNRWKRLTLNANTGDLVRLYGSVQVTSGWTATAGAPGVWQRSGWTFNGAANSPNGGCVDINRPSGPANIRPFTVYRRITQNQAPTVLVEGDVMVNSTTNTMYIFPFSGADPNTLTLELANRDYCVSVGGGTEAFDNGRVLGEGVECYFAYNTNCRLERVQAVLDDVKAYGASVGGGITSVDADLTAYNPVSIGNFGDNFGTVASGDTITRKPVITLFSPIGSGAISASSDGFSAHDNAEWRIFGGRFDYNGKDGVVFAPTNAGGYGACYNTTATGNADTGFKNAGDPSTGITQQMDCVNCFATGNAIGFGMANTVTASQGPLLMNLTSCVTNSNTTAGIRIANANGAGRASENVINGVNCVGVGNGAPSVNNNGTLNLVTTVPIT